MHKEQVLIVDDEEMILDLVTKMLGRAGWSVLVSSSAERALEIVEKEKIDLLLTDVKMSGLGGMNLVRAFKNKLPASPVVIMTGYGTVDTAIEAINLGVSGFLMKPFENKDLLRVVDEAFEKERLKKENIRLRSLFPIFGVSRLLMQNTNMDDFFGQLVDVVKKETSADAVSIAIKDENKDFYIAAEDGLSRGYVKGRTLKKTGFISRSAERGEALLLNSDNASSPYYAEMARKSISSAMVLPLKIDGVAEGILSVSKSSSSSGKYGEVDLGFMGIMAGQAASVLKNVRLIDDLQELFVGSIRALSSAVDAKSPWTAGHSERVTSYACGLGSYLGLNKDLLYDLEVASILHDVGKIGVYESMLDKRGKLTKHEYEIMKTHPGIGGEILANIKKLQHLIPVVRGHHESYDGSGYPDNLTGDDIPVLARVLCVVDTYDAMRADRPYRKGRDVNYILKEFKRCSGSQFDPHIAEAFIEILSDNKLHADLLINTPKVRSVDAYTNVLSSSLKK